ncbi:MAG: hypothetical protein AAGG01_21990, partial [Planctomycetota bacterium]
MAVNQARTLHPGPMWVVLAVHKEKNVKALAAPLQRTGACEIICCSIASSGVHLEATELVERLSDMASDVVLTAIDEPEEALRAACAKASREEGGWVFVTGSLYVVGAVRGVLFQPS